METCRTVRQVYLYFCITVADDVKVINFNSVIKKNNATKILNFLSEIVSHVGCLKILNKRPTL